MNGYPFAKNVPACPPNFDIEKTPSFQGLGLCNALRWD